MKKTEIKSFKRITRILLLFIFVVLNTNIYSQEEPGSRLHWSKPIKKSSVQSLSFGKKYGVFITASHTSKSALVLSSKDFSVLTNVNKTKLDGKSIILVEGRVFHNKYIAVGGDKKLFIFQYDLPSFNMEKSFDLGYVSCEFNMVYLPGTGKKNSGILLELGQYNNGVKQKNNRALFSQSTNNDFLLITIDNSVRGSKNAKIIYKIFDKDFNITEGTIKFEVASSEFMFMNSFVTNSGEAYILYADMSIPAFKLYDIKEKYTLPDDIDFNIMKHQITEIDNKIVFDGLPSNNELSRFFTFKLDLITNILSEPIFTDFDSLLTYEYVDAKSIKNDNSKNRPLFYSIDGVKYLDDSSKYIYGEHTKQHLNLSNEIYIAHIDKKGNLISFDIIPKWQRSYTKSLLFYPMWYSYIAYLDDDDRMHFIFHDHPANNYADLHKKHAYVASRSEQTTEYIVTPGESMTRRIWLNNGTNKLYPSPFISFDLDNGTYLIGSHLKKNFRFTYLEY